VVLFDLGQDVVGNRLQAGRAVLDGQPFDIADHDLAALDLLLEHELEDAAGFLGDIRANAVTFSGMRIPKRLTANEQSENRQVEDDRENYPEGKQSGDLAEFAAEATNSFHRGKFPRPIFLEE